MAPVLQCPDCGQKHAVPATGTGAAFRCSGCGRMLKVPVQLLPEVDDDAPAPSYFPPRRVPAPIKTRRPGGTELPRVARIAIWILAVPIGFFIVFGGARLFGIFSLRQLENVFLLPGWNRFWPVARLLPLWALVTTLVVHFGNIGLARLREVRRARKAGGGPARGPRLRNRRTFSGRSSGVRRGPLRSSEPAEAPTRTSRVS